MSDSKGPGTIFFELGTLFALWHYSEAPWWLFGALLAAGMALNLPGTIRDMKRDA
ncbi:unnamed protein product [marine sediment metagenome]|uniref:Uncharacterized protein n=1 Tax=marine sediment metagenome TaxID=412755 RepID=X0T4Y2_9ZZZZ